MGLGVVVKCSACGCEQFRKDGRAKYPYGERQRLRCKQCRKPAMGDWLSFDEREYQKVKRLQFKKWQQDKEDYVAAKEQYGMGGFRLSDL